MTDTGGDPGLHDRFFGVQNAVIGGEALNTSWVCISNGMFYLFHGSEPVREVVAGVEILSLDKVDDEKLADAELGRRKRAGRNWFKLVAVLADDRVVDLRPGVCFCSHSLKNVTTLAGVRSVIAGHEAEEKRREDIAAKRLASRREPAPRVSEAERLRNMLSRKK